MMASRVLSRFLPGAESDYHDLEIDPVTTDRTLEAGTRPQVPDRFKDDADDLALEDMMIEAAGESTLHPDDAKLLGDSKLPPRPSEIRHGGPKPRWMQQTSAALPEEEDDVPQSLIMESRKKRVEDPLDRRSKRVHSQDHRESQWRAAQHQQRLHSDNPTRHQAPIEATTNATRSVKTRQDPKEQALWRWTNVQNVDGFLLEVYQYFSDHGIWSIMLSRVLYLLTTLFLFSMYMFLSSCVDFSKVPTSRSTSEILIPQCMKNTSWVKNVMLWLFVFWWSSAAFRYFMDVRRLWHLHDFFLHLLNIPDDDLQTIPWERVVEALMNLRNANPETADTIPAYLRKASKHTQSKQRMDAHDIANRLMRRDNYYIALINKEILDLSLPLPFAGNRQFYSKSLEWCLGFCFENFIFDEQGHIQPACLDAKKHRQMVGALSRRLRFAALISIFMAPFNIGAHCIYYFSRYYAEFRNSPAQLGARAFTPLAEWKMREFNELEHDFRRRIKMAYPFADRYLNQFPKDKTNQTLQFVSLVTGTVAAILGIATLLDPELFLGFEITPGRTAFFYISVCMGIFATTRGAVPDDIEVHEPVLHLFEVIEYTHYFPQRWKTQLHSNNVKIEFSALYQMKILIFMQEILSLVVAPFILWRNSGEQSRQIISFFKSCTVNVDGIGDVCNHAVFDFRKRKNIEDNDAGKDADGLREEYLGGKDDKMAMSQYYFLQRVGRYDQQQASRYQRHNNIHLPPAFPPLSPLREAAGNSPSRYRERPAPQSKQHPAASLRSPSPQRSILLDLQHKRHPTTTSRRPNTSTSRHDRSLRVPTTAPEKLAEEEDIEPTDFADLTTSKLIEQDADLDDSWKTERGAQGGENDDVTSGKPRGGGNGVLGLLVEFSKAHAEGKGARRGSNFG